MQRVSGFIRKIKKGLRATAHPLFRKGLKHRVAPCFEHETVLRALPALHTIIDAGANRGQFSLVARATHPQAKILAFEPLPQAAKVYESIFAKDDAVKLTKVALGSSAGTNEIFVSVIDSSSSLLPQRHQSTYFPKTVEQYRTQIQVERLDSCIVDSELKSPSLLKLDVQGFELEALRGAKKVLPKFDWLYVELAFVEFYEGQPKAHEVINWLASQNFEITSVIESPGMDFEGIVTQCDFLFRKSDQKN